MSDFTKIKFKEIGGGIFRLICPECGQNDPVTVSAHRLGMMALKEDFNTVCGECSQKAAIRTNKPEPDSEGGSHD